MKLTAYVIRKDDPPWPLEPASTRRLWMDKTVAGFAYHCLPLTMANSMGWVIRCPVTFWAEWNGETTHHNSMRLGFQETAHDWPHAIHSHFGLGIITFQLPWLFRTDEKGVGLIARGLPNYFKPNCHALEGYTETWWNPFTFTMNWKIIAPHTPVLFERGDPICFIQPYRPTTVEMFEPEIQELPDHPKLEKEFKKWRRKRDDFNVSTQRGPGDWQKFYQKGEGCPHAQLPTHRTAVKPKEFTMSQPPASGGDDGEEIQETQAPSTVQDPS